MNQEPDLKTAIGWWEDLPNIWTCVGWKDHLFRLTVFYSGMILAQPHLNRRTEAWKGQGVQLGFVPQTPLPEFTPDKVSWSRCNFTNHDDGMVTQGWNNCPAPVLWTEHSAHGCLLTQEIFAHVPGGKEITTGIEPLFAWIRLSVKYTCPGLPLEDKIGFMIKINAPHVWTSMSMRNNIFYDLEHSAYPGKLAPEKEKYDVNSGYKLLEEEGLEKNGKVRLGFPSNQKCGIMFTHGAPEGYYKNDYFMYVEMDAKKGAHVDMLLPVLPTGKDVFEKELSLGYNNALKETNKFWSIKPSTRAEFLCPEEHINKTIEQTLKFAEIHAERDPATGLYSRLSGGFVYANVWATPSSMESVMLLDTMGYHSVVEKYIDLFKKEQGTVVPPGDCFELHPGYLSTPKTLTSIDWLSDHGAILYAIAEHLLLSGEKSHIDKWLDVIVKALEFIKYARSIKGHGGYEGIMPPAIATDACTKIQAVWNNGWIYKGLVTAIKLLKKINHPRAEEFQKEADEFKIAFDKAIRHKTKSMAVWKDAKGRKHRFIPTSLFGDTKAESIHAFYLDTGPLFLVFSGLLDADDELMESTRLWFREGPQAKYLDRGDSNAFQVPVLHHEMSSCEPCYSFNVFHNHQLGDRTRYLEGMYSLLVGSVSRKTYVSCETRGGITGNIFSAPVGIYLARLAVIDDQIKENELHLLRVMPLSWITKDREFKYDNAPTEYGPVSLRVKLGMDGKSLDVKFKPKFRIQPEKIILHVPPVPGLKKIIFNGKPVPVAKKKFLEINP